MAEYYPLLSKAVGSLPNSTADSRRVVYERARKALIGQLRTLHPPVPDADIDRESLELDRAIEKLETELATVAPTTSERAPQPSMVPSEPKAPPANGGAPGAIAGSAARTPIAPLRPRIPVPKTATPLAASPPESPPIDAAPVADAAPSGVVPTEGTLPAEVARSAVKSDDTKPPRHPLQEPGAKPRLDMVRPIAPQPPVAPGPKRRLWIIPAGLSAVVLLVAVAAWELRDRPEIVTQKKPSTEAQTASGKIVERVGGAPDSDTPAETGSETPAKPDSQAVARPPASQQPASPPLVPQQPSSADQPQQATTPAASNPELPVAHRAALLIEAPDEPNKVKTFLGTVIWKLNNISDGPNDTVGLGVEADIDLPDDRTKVIVSFEKNTDASLPASHTIKVRFLVQPGSSSGDVKQISVPQMRREDSPSGEPLAGVTVPVIQNSFLVGLSPGNAETANLQLINGQQWMDIPMLLTSGKIAKLTFEKSDSGQRDIAEALTAWQKM